VKEEHRHDNFKPKLLVGKEEYESFDEIYERYIVPCNNHMEAAANNKKFVQERIEQVEKRLREEKELDVAIVPYGFCVSDRAPQYLVLMYVPKDKIEREYIKVKPEGLAFHGQVFSTLKELTSWFKTNFRTTEYKTYMRKTKAPFTDTDKVH
jgi:transcription elongation factor SPT6